LRQNLRNVFWALLLATSAFAWLTFSAGTRNSGVLATENPCVPDPLPEARCADVLPFRHPGHLPVVGVYASELRAIGTSDERKGIVTARSVTGPLPADDAMLLWGRHAAKMVDMGDVQYVALAPRRRQPMSVAIYARASGGVWAVAFADHNAQAHQPPTLHLDEVGRLQLIYSEHNTGILRHRVFQRGTGLALHEQGEMSTAAWGAGNFYIGTAMDESRTRIIGCAQNFKSALFRCAQFKDGQWRIKLSRNVGPSVRLLYPNISAGSKDAWIVSSGFPTGSPDNSARLATDVIKLTYDDKDGTADMQSGSERGSVAEGGELRAQIGGTAMMEPQFDEDVERDASGLRVLLTGVKTGELSLLEIEQKTSAQRLVRLPARWGSSHNLQRIGSSLVVVGAGRILCSADLGRTWSELTYEATNFPKSQFNYLVAHTLKGGRFGLRTSGKLVFLQEVQNISTKELEVIEIEFESPLLNPGNARAANLQNGSSSHTPMVQ
jgi:hypothetical protein